MAVPEHISRRRLLAALGVLGLAGAGVFVMGGPIGFARRIDAWILRRADLSREPAGPLRPGSAALLSAVVEALVGLPVERGHYERHYALRAEKLPGYRVLYERIADYLRSEGQNRGTAFPDLPPTERRVILSGLIDLEVSAGSRRMKAILSPSAAQIHRHFVEDTLRLFDATDAWVILGYEGWPGTPRGIDAYRQPPRPPSAKVSIAQ